MKATLLSNPSTHYLPAGTYYGLTVAPAVGGTVVVADLTSAGHNPNISTGSTWTGAINDYHFVAAGNPEFIPAGATHIHNYLVVAFTSTRSITVFHD